MRKKIVLVFSIMLMGMLTAFAHLPRGRASANVSWSFSWGASHNVSSSCGSGSQIIILQKSYYKQANCRRPARRVVYAKRNW